MTYKMKTFDSVDQTYLTHSHINATIVLADVKVEIFVVDPQVATLGKFTFEATRNCLEN